MRKVLLVSPHFDDAILSAGQFMADRPDTEVVTVFGGFPSKPGDVHTDYDKKCGFKNAHDAVAERQRENDAATALLNATAINLHFPDSQYGTKTPAAKIASELERLIEDNDYEFIIGPLGLGHPDHMVVNDALMMLSIRPVTSSEKGVNIPPIHLWEDLPLRVMEPELVMPRLDHVSRDRMWMLTQHTTTDRKIAMKMRALAAYKSQIGTGILDPYVLYVPERFWTHG